MSLRGPNISAQAKFYSGAPAALACVSFSVLMSTPFLGLRPSFEVAPNCTPLISVGQSRVVVGKHDTQKLKGLTKLAGGGYNSGNTNT